MQWVCNANCTTMQLNPNSLQRTGCNLISIAPLDLYLFSFNFNILSMCAIIAYSVNKTVNLLYFCFTVFTAIVYIGYLPSWGCGSRENLQTHPAGSWPLPGTFPWSGRSHGLIDIESLWVIPRPLTFSPLPYGAKGAGATWWSLSFGHTVIKSYRGR